MEAKRALLLFSFAIILSISLGEQLSDQSHNWKYFVFSQWWPQSQCYFKKDAVSTDDQSFRIVNDYKFRNDCVPTDVENWTIHGLWPTVNGKPDPSFCNKSWPFDKDKIEDLKPKMMKQWIALPDVSESEELWKHEWEKHGTCASTLPAVSNEHDYFFKTLKLNLQYDLRKMFAGEALPPSDDKTYKVEDFEDAIMNNYGVKGRVICLDGPDGDQYLAGFRICLDKAFNPINCLETEPEKCHGSSLKYPVIIRG